VVAIIALVVATAGTAGAATKVLIKSSAQVRNGALQTKDLSAKARKSLRGRQGRTGPAGAAGVAGARGPSDVFTARSASLNTALCAVTGCDPGTVLKTLSVPAGQFVVESTVELEPTTFVANDSQSVECHLVRADTGAFQRTLELYRAAATAGTTAMQTVNLSWAVTLPAATTVSLTCSVGAVKYDAFNARITAIQIATLAETVS
jgi:hypothetical protein